MLVGPIVFCTIVLGIAHMRDLPRVGRVGIKALAYFELLSTVALAVGMAVAALARPGAGFHVDPATLDAAAVAKYASAAHEQSVADFLLNVIPATLPGALTSGELLQVLLVALLTGFGSRSSASGRSSSCRSSTPPRRCCSASSPSSCGSRRSAPSARWPTRSASSAGTPSRRWRASWACST